MSYPVMLQIEGKKAVVIGGGEVATRKITSLLKSKAFVMVIAPSIKDELMTFVRQGKMVWRKKTFEPSDVEGAFIVIAATNIPTVNVAIYEAAKDKLLNIVDRPDLCSFHVPAVFKRGSLTLAISTNGISPALAKEIKGQLEQLFDHSYEEFLHFLKRSREVVLENVKDEKRRKKLFQQLVSESFYKKKDWELSFEQMMMEIEKNENKLKGNENVSK